MTAHAHETHYCPKCSWQDAAPEAFPEKQRASIALSLRPGDVMPSGRCPMCAAPAYPSRLHAGTIINAGDARDVPDTWAVRIHRVSDALMISLTHPRGHGCETLLEIQGERPTVSITPWSRAGDLLDREPLGVIKAGEDHLLFWNGLQDFSSTIVATPEVSYATLPMSYVEWDDLRGWSDIPPDRDLQPARPDARK